MRTRTGPLFLLALALATLILAGCSSGGDSTDVGDTSGTTTGDTNAGLEVGTTAPDFRMKNQDQETIALSDYKGTKNVILVFYPADFTPV